MKHRPSCNHPPPFNLAPRGVDKPYSWRTGVSEIHDDDFSKIETDTKRNVAFGEIRRIARGISIKK
jgi:hypothetical protein